MIVKYLHNILKLNKSMYMLYFSKEDLLCYKEIQYFTIGFGLLYSYQ